MALDITWPDKLQPKDHELILWLIFNRHGLWDHASRELCFGGWRYVCALDSMGIPQLDDHTRAALRDLYRAMDGRVSG